MISAVSVGAKTLADLIIRWLDENELTTIPNFICSSSENAEQEPLLWTDSFLIGTFERFIKSIWGTHDISPAGIFSSAQTCCTDSLFGCLVCKGSWELLSSTTTTNVYLYDEAICNHNFTESFRSVLCPTNSQKIQRLFMQHHKLISEM